MWTLCAASAPLPPPRNDGTAVWGRGWRLLPQHLLCRPTDRRASRWSSRRAPVARCSGARAWRKLVGRAPAKQSFKHARHNT